MSTNAQAELERLEELAALYDAQHKLRCEQSLAFFFANVVWPVVEGNRELVWNWPIILLAKNAEQVMQGSTVSRFIVNCAMRFGKSLLLSVSLPLWWWLKHPGHKFAFYSYGEQLRVELARKREKVLRSPRFQKYWGDRVSLPTRTNISRLANEQGGEFVLLGPGSTGHGGDAIIIDDPASARQSVFEAQLQRQEDHVKEVIFSRLNDRRGPIIVIQQRQAPDDLSGTLSREEGWHSTIIPPIFEEQTEIEVFSGGRLAITKGTLVDPVRFSADNLDEMRRRLGRRAFEAGILQKPPTGEEIIKQEWILPFDSLSGDWRAATDAAIIAVDTASVGTKGHSRFGINIFGVKSVQRTRSNQAGTPVSEYVNLYFLLATATRHCEFSEAKKIILRLAAEHKTTGIWLENATTGPVLAQELTRAGCYGVRLITINRSGKKADRLWAATPAIEDGRLYVPYLNTDWGKNFLEDILRCRKRLPENDPAWDNADTLSLFLNEAEAHAGISAVCQLANWAGLESVTGKPKTEKPWPLGFHPFTPDGYIHEYDFKRLSQNLLPEHCEEVLYGMVDPSGQVYDVTEEEISKLLAEGWTYEAKA